MITSIMPTYAPSKLTFEKGDGAYLYDSNGKSYIDFSSGIAVTSLGHNHPVLVNALKNAVDNVWHLSNLYTINGQKELADKIVKNSFAETVFFTNSGTESIECLIKIVRKYFNHIKKPNKYRIITFEGAFHGRTFAALSAGKQKKHLDGFGPHLKGFDQVSFGDIDELKKSITDDTAAILLEPIQGEGGIRVFPKSFIYEVKKICEQYEILLCFDEVQTGIGRTGSLFAHQLWEIEPDILATAKGLGGGFPVGACLSTAKVAGGMVPGTHGSTFGGNPLAMAAANAVIDTILKGDFLNQVCLLSEKLMFRLNKIKNNNENK
ncbi:MAG: acetylornithine transaminase, partial [Rhodospirillaceae bacterium]|nr:acetylornithine transaminase [Rhodospirillaceae bacterium]